MGPIRGLKNRSCEERGTREIFKSWSKKIPLDGAFSVGEVQADVSENTLDDLIRLLHVGRVLISSITRYDV
jgi:hypothetical protein